MLYLATAKQSPPLTQHHPPTQIPSESFQNSLQSSLKGQILGTAIGRDSYSLNAGTQLMGHACDYYLLWLEWVPKTQKSKY